MTILSAGVNLPGEVSSGTGFGFGPGYPDRCTRGIHHRVVVNFHQVPAFASVVPPVLIARTCHQ